MSTVITCLECGTEFKGRSDKKFCTDQCRSSFNNRLNADSNNTVRNINNALRKNRRILDELLSEKKDRISREKLVQKGFNFKYHTHAFTSKTGKNYLFYYDRGLMVLENNQFFIVKDSVKE